MTHSFITNSDYLINQGFFKDTPYAALRAPRSRCDKDMLGNKAIKPTIRVFLVAEFCISPGKTGQLPKKVIVTFFGM